MFLVYDLSSFVTWFLDWVIQIISTCLEIIGSFQFYGISLLVYVLAVGLIAFGLESVIAISKPNEKVKIKKGGK